MPCISRIRGNDYGTCSTCGEGIDKQVHWSQVDAHLRAHGTSAKFRGRYVHAGWDVEYVSTNGAVGNMPRVGVIV